MHRTTTLKLLVKTLQNDIQDGLFCKGTNEDFFALFSHALGIDKNRIIELCGLLDGYKDTIYLEFYLSNGEAACIYFINKNGYKFIDRESQLGITKQFYIYVDDMSEEGYVGGDMMPMSDITQCETEDEAFAEFERYITKWLSPELTAEEIAIDRATTLKLLIKTLQNEIFKGLYLEGMNEDFCALFSHVLGIDKNRIIELCGVVDGYKDTIYLDFYLSNGEAACIYFVDKNVYNHNEEESQLGITKRFYTYVDDLSEEGLRLGKMKPMDGIAQCDTEDEAFVEFERNVTNHLSQN